MAALASTTTCGSVNMLLERAPATPQAARPKALFCAGLRLAATLKPRSSKAASAAADSGSAFSVASLPLPLLFCPSRELCLGADRVLGAAVDTG